MVQPTLRHPRRAHKGQCSRLAAAVITTLCVLASYAFGQGKPSHFREFYDRLLYPTSETGLFKPGDVVSSRREILPIGIEGTPGDTLYYVVTYAFELDLPGAEDPTSDEMSLLVVEDIKTAAILGQYQWAWSRADRLNVPWFSVWQKALPRSEGEALLRARQPGPLARGVDSPEGRMKVKLIPNRGVSPPSATDDLDRLSTRDPAFVEHYHEEGLLWESAINKSRGRFSGKLIMLPANGRTRLLQQYRPGRPADESYDMRMSWRFYWNAAATKLICIEGEQYTIQRNFVQAADEPADPDEEFSVLRERVVVSCTGKSR